MLKLARIFTVFMVLTLNVSELTVADEKVSNPLDKPWDMDFFAASCPGMRLPATIVQAQSKLVDFDADNINMPQKDIVEFKGNVTLVYGLQNLVADKATLDKSNDIFKAEWLLSFQLQLGRPKQRCDLPMVPQSVHSRLLNSREARLRSYRPFASY